MNINFEKLNRRSWWEDADGNIIPQKENEVEAPANAKYYHRCFPLELTEYVDEYCYHPQNPFVKFLCKSKMIYRLISKGKNKTFRPIFHGTTSFGSEWAQKCIVAMVNSGDFTLEQAIWTFANSCERCMNVLLYRYLNGAEGYEEYTDEWKRCNTVCDFCKGESDGSRPA